MSELSEILKDNKDKLKEYLVLRETNCFRAFDREDKRFPISIDVYSDFAHIQFYETIERELTSEFKNSIQESILDGLGIKKEKQIFKIRKKQKDGKQYEKISESRKKFIVKELGSKYYINLIDYLDTGLFLDHRETRRIFQERVQGKRRILNLFSYTGAFNLAAASVGVEFTTAVDMSNTYCNWAKENFELNGLDIRKHIAIRENVFFFLENIKSKNWKFDAIVIDPPTVSRSKKMLNKFDIQRDYPVLINESLRYLEKDGFILFSTNFQKFKLERQTLDCGSIEEITPETIPMDFQNKRIHRVFIITN
ncbi:MAG: class I SAM-dependent methyltransferase [Leptospiraceae bacterium]|nr:class I SAM-dependent methyltransferase [Leptospiraceae bacterium]